MEGPSAARSLGEILCIRAPAVGELVLVRARLWLVEEVVPSGTLGQTALVRLACADDDAQGLAFSVYWDYELDRRILEEEGWKDLAAKGFDPPRRFAELSATTFCSFRYEFSAPEAVSAGVHAPPLPSRPAHRP